MTDHVGQVETDVIPFDRSDVFLRMLMGLTFLPDSLIGIDSTITRSEAGERSDVTFASQYQHFPFKKKENCNPSILLFAPSSGSSVDPFTVTSTPVSTLASRGYQYNIDWCQCL